MRSRPLTVALLAGSLALSTAPVVAQSPGVPARPAASVAPAVSASPAPSVVVADPALARAVEATMGAGTVRTAFSVVFQGSGSVPDGTTISGDGQMSLGVDRHQRLSLDMTAFGLGRLELIVDGDLLYVKGLPLGDDVDPDTWIVADLTSDDPSVAALKALASGNNDASLLLYYLLGATQPAESLGEEALEGVATQHLGATVDLDRALALVPADMRDTLAANLAEVRTSGVDPLLGAEVWVDAQDLIHRVQFDYTLGEAMGGGGMTATFDFRQHGEPLDLGIPAPDETVDVTTLD